MSARVPGWLSKQGVRALVGVSLSVAPPPRWECHIRRRRGRGETRTAVRVREGRTGKHHSVACAGYRSQRAKLKPGEGKGRQSCGIYTTYCCIFFHRCPTYESKLFISIVMCFHIGNPSRSEASDTIGIKRGFPDILNKGYSACQSSAKLSRSRSK